MVTSTVHFFAQNLEIVEKCLIARLLWGAQTIAIPKILLMVVFHIIVKFFVS